MLSDPAPPKPELNINQDGAEDLVLSNDRQYWLYLFDGPEKGWAKKVAEGKAGVYDFQAETDSNVVDVSDG